MLDFSNDPQYKILKKKEEALLKENSCLRREIKRLHVKLFLISFRILLKISLEFIPAHWITSTAWKWPQGISLQYFPGNILTTELTLHKIICLLPCNYT